VRKFPFFNSRLINKSAELFGDVGRIPCVRGVDIGMNGIGEETNCGESMAGSSRDQPLTGSSEAGYSPREEYQSKIAEDQLELKRILYRCGK
jgi:hypothetical protein